MNDLIDLKTVKITAKGQIALPHDVRKNGFRKGSKIAILAYGDHIELRPLKTINLLQKEGMITALISESSLAKKWNTKEEDEAWKNL